MHASIIQPGQTFGRLTIIERVANSKEGRVRVKCSCKCGTVKDYALKQLKSGCSKSCGCINIERFRTHGGTGTPEHGTWGAMNQRCYNTQNGYYHLYGGRGITVSPLWRHDFGAFLRDVGKRPSPTHSLDRFPNCNGNYEPGNVRWATPDQQNRNMRSNARILVNGVEHRIVDLIDESGKAYEKAYKRLRYRHRVANNICTRCGSTAAAANRRDCTPCSNLVQSRRRELRRIRSLGESQ